MQQILNCSAVVVVNDNMASKQDLSNILTFYD